MSANEKKGGLEAVIEMFQVMEPQERDRLLVDLARRDPELARKVQEGMFTFESAARLELPLLQALIRAVPSTSLALALRGTPEAVSEAFFRALSKRAADALREEIQALGPQRLSDVEAARAQIARLGRDLQSQKKV